jgi:hypothetical protein
VTTKLNDSLRNCPTAFGALPGDIDAHFLHYIEHQWVSVNRLDGGAGRHDFIARECAKKSLGHLAASGISRREKQNFRLTFHCWPS